MSLRYEPGESRFSVARMALIPTGVLIETVGFGRILKPEGWLLLELGYNGRSAVEADVFRMPRGIFPIVRADLAGIDRVLAIRRRS